MCESQSLNSSPLAPPPLDNLKLVLYICDYILLCKQVHLYHFSRVRVELMVPADAGLL